MNKPQKRRLSTFFKLVRNTLFLGGIALLFVTIILYPFLPDIETLKDVRLQVPLKVYTKDGDLIAEFGEKKRSPLDYNEFPPKLIKAILSAEDARFYDHPGVDYQGILRAVVSLLRTGERSQGGSTITMQVARNFFLSRERTFLRKFNEILLAFKIESKLSKAEILELYLNKIYLGKRSYGFAAAAQVYYNKTLYELGLHELAMLAGLPKAPSRYNPVVNSRRATQRRNYVLSRMYDLGYIFEEDYQKYSAMKDYASVHGQDIDVDAPYVAEMVRTEMLERYGKDAYTLGYKVFTTVESKLQLAASQSLRTALLEYDRRHGYKGVIKHVELFDDVPEEPMDEPVVTGPVDLTSGAVVAELYEAKPEQDYWDYVLRDVPKVGNLLPALVLQVDQEEVYAYAEDRMVYIPWEKLQWARRYINDNEMGPELRSAQQVLKPGDVIMVTAAEEGCSWLAQEPKVAGALVSLAPSDGALLALSGGFDYYASKFNRAIQANRQPGSSFKPFVYTSALDKGYTAASLINDAPVVFDAPGLEDTWRPENYSGKFYGPTRLRKALINSRNLVSIRLLRSIGIGYATNYIKRFGFKRPALPRDLSLALGSGTLTPMELATGYTVFANGGFKVEPYFIDHIVDPDDRIIRLAQPVQVCVSCVEAIEKKKAEEAEAKAKEEALAAEQLRAEQLKNERMAEPALPVEPVDMALPGQTEPGAVDESLSVVETAPRLLELPAEPGLQPEGDAPQEEADRQPEMLGEQEASVFGEQMEELKPSRLIPQLVDIKVEGEHPTVWLGENSEVIPFEGPLPIRVAPRVLSPQTRFLITTMMKDVVRFGTGRRALALKRADLAGKTGTTNDQRDAWFTGFNGDVVTVSWVGFDTPHPLGARETGARAALPMWVDYMRTALEGRPETPLEQPPGVVTVRIDEKTGKVVSADSPDAIFEYFLSDQVPEEEVGADSNEPGTPSTPSNITEQLF